MRTSNVHKIVIVSLSNKWTKRVKEKSCDDDDDDDDNTWFKEPHQHILSSNHSKKLN